MNLYENRWMPKRKYVPPEEHPYAVKVALQVINMTPIREQIFRALALHPKSTTRQIAEYIEGDYRTVWSHLKELRGLGLVKTEIPPGDGHVSPLFTLDKEELAKHFAAALTYALGEDVRED